MSFGPRTRIGPLVRSSAASGVALALVLLLALPAGAAAGPTKLLDPSVSPTTGSPSTVFAFRVTYRNREGSPPDYVRVAVGGVAHAMSASGSAWKDGVTFTWASTLPVGRHTVEFRAMDRERFSDTITGPSIVVVAATPRPTATPTPKPPPATPKPTPPPTPRPTAVPTAAATPTATTPAATPTATTPVATATPTASPVAPANTAVTGGTHPTDAPPAATADPTDRPTTAPPGGAAPIDPGAGGPPTVDPATRAGPDPAGSAFSGWGDLTSALDILGLRPARPLGLQLLPAVVASTGGVALLMAFMFFGKRRRDGEPPEPDEVLAAKAARVGDQVADGALVPPATGATSTTATLPADPDALLPRWRRPSLLEARRADPLRDAVPTTTMSFSRSAVNPVEGLERRLIRYHVVELLDGPDELRCERIGALTQGDEVQLLERSGSHWHVLCPDGRQGWIHKMTLGEVVGAAPPPSATRTWGMRSDSDEVDDDVLTAFMAARGRA